MPQHSFHLPLFLDFLQPRSAYSAVHLEIFSHFRIALRAIRYYKFAMQTLVLRIPDNLAKEMEVEARESNLTKSEVARRRLIAAGSQSPRTASGFDLIADLIGTVEGGPADMSARMKHYLNAQGYGTSRRPR